MTKRKRRNYTPASKAKVALVAVKGDKTRAELAVQARDQGSQFVLHINALSPPLRRPHAGADDQRSPASHRRRSQADPCR